MVEQSRLTTGYPVLSLLLARSATVAMPEEIIPTRGRGLAQYGRQSIHYLSHLPWRKKPLVLRTQGLDTKGFGQGLAASQGMGWHRAGPCSGVLQGQRIMLGVWDLLGYMDDDGQGKWIQSNGTGQSLLLPCQILSE